MSTPAMRPSLEPGISKSFRIFLRICGLLASLFAFFYLVVPVPYQAMVHWPFNDPVYTGLLGVTYLAFAIGTLLAVKAGSWREVRLFVRFSLVWLGMISAFSIYSIFGIPMPEEALGGVLLDTAITCVLTLVLLGFYTKQERHW